MSLPPALHHLQRFYFHQCICHSARLLRKTKDWSAMNKGVILPGTSIFGLLIYWFSHQLLIEYRTISQISLEVLPCWGLFCYENQTHLNFPCVLDTSPSGPWAWSIPEHTYTSSWLSFSWHWVTTAFQKTHAFVELGLYVQLTKHLILHNCYSRVLLILWGVLSHMMQWLPR